MSKYKIYIKKNIENEYDIFFNHYARKQGVIGTKLNSYGVGKLYIGKTNEGNYDPINNSNSVDRMKTLDVNLHMPQNNAIDVINIKQKLPGGVQALMNNQYNQPFSYIGSGLTNGSTIFGDFVA